MYQDKGIIVRPLKIDEIKNVSGASNHSTTNVEIRLSFPLFQFAQYSELFAQLSTKQINENVFFQTLADFAVDDSINICFIESRFFNAGNYLGERNEIIK
jgi:hypothetical protein